MTQRRPEDLFPILRRMRGSGDPFDPMVDEAALLIAQRITEELSDKLNIALTRGMWTQMTAIIQTRVATALRHAAFDKPDFPANRYEEGT